MDSLIALLPEPIPLRPILPTVLGNVDYQLFRSQLERIDQMLIRSGMEDQMVSRGLQRWQAQGGPPRPSVRSQLKYQEQARLALRCNLARVLLGESFRDFSAHVADSSLLQWFCQRQQLDRVQVPSKSTLQRYATWYPEEEIRHLNAQLLGQAAQEHSGLALEEPIDLEGMLLDTTCVPAAIHFPVDWVLLRDATRTLLKAIELIRRHGLKHRMPDPQELMSQMNKRCMAMSHARRRSHSRRERKRLLRWMKGAVEQVARHARRYRDLLARSWERTDWTRAQAQQVMDRMEGILNQLPAAKKQAHERIIGQRPVPNSEKILSLYEPDVRVIVRHKAGAEVEFGNGLLVAENPQGLILHWELFQEQPPADAQLVRSTVARVEATYGIGVQMVGADRGFESRANVNYLEAKEIFNGLCARQPGQLRQRLRQDEAYEATQRRRAQTEGRIGILKNQFLGRPPRAKGFARRHLAVGWGVLTHNLWVLARLPGRAAPPQAAPKPKAA